MGTTIALNLAVEFWEPLKTFVGQILSKAEKRAEGIKNGVVASKLDDEAKESLLADAEEWAKDLRECSARNKKNAGAFSRWSSISSAAIGTVILYMGFASKWNGLLLLPIIVFLLWSALVYGVLSWKVYSIRKKLGNKVTSHILDGEAISRKFPASIQTSGEPESKKSQSEDT